MVPEAQDPPLAAEIWVLSGDVTCLQPKTIASRSVTEPFDRLCDSDDCDAIPGNFCSDVRDFVRSTEPCSLIRSCAGASFQVCKSKVCDDLHVIFVRVHVHLEKCRKGSRIRDTGERASQNKKEV